MEGKDLLGNLFFILVNDKPSTLLTISHCELIHSIRFLFCIFTLCVGLWFFSSFCLFVCFISFVSRWSKGVITKKIFKRELSSLKKKKLKYVSPYIEQHFTANDFWCISGQVIGIISGQKTIFNCNDVNNNWGREKRRKDRSEEKREKIQWQQNQ